MSIPYNRVGGIFRHLEPRTFSPTVLPSLPVEGLQKLPVGVSEVAQAAWNLLTCQPALGLPHFRTVTRALTYEPQPWGSILPILLLCQLTPPKVTKPYVKILVIHRSPGTLLWQLNSNIRPLQSPHFCYRHYKLLMSMIIQDVQNTQDFWIVYE